MSKQVVALRHVAFEDLGSYEPVLVSRGYTVRYVDAPTAEIERLDADEPALLVVLGGPIGANDEALYPFVAAELALIERRLARRRPLLGVCLGAQLAARALGSRVFPAAREEIGWSPVALTEAGALSALGRLKASELHVLHWHGDTFDLPAGATHLASTSLCPNQAFSWGGCALALQFHLEVTREAMERWLVGHAVQLAATPGLSVPGLRAHAARWAGPVSTAGADMLGSWLDELTV